MDRKTLLRLRRRLKSTPRNRKKRLVIQTVPRSPREAVPPAPKPNRFRSRTDYRRALIDFENRMIHPDPEFDDLIERLGNLGLDMQVSRPSQTVVVEGLPSALGRALEEEGVEEAGFDEQIELIRPVGR